jgi:hypothetical protein
MDLQEQYKGVVQRLAKVDFNSLWPGFHSFPFALYNEKGVCLNGTIIPKTDEFIANTSIMYQGKHTAIFQVGPEEDLDILASKVAHESFHCFQEEQNEKRFPNEIKAIFEYEYLKDNLALKGEENNILTELVSCFDSDLWNRFLDLRKYRSFAFPEEFSYESKVEQIEGSANYIELKSLEAINPIAAAKKLEMMRDGMKKADFLFPIRIGLYASGAFVLKICKDNKIPFESTFSERTFIESLIENRPVIPCQANDAKVSQSLRAFKGKMAKIIKKAVSAEPLEKGSFDLRGLNVFDALHQGNYVYSTCFVAYADKGQERVIYGDYLLEFSENKIIRIYRC